MLKVVSIRRADQPRIGERAGFLDLAVLAHDDRHVRRKVIGLVHGERVLIDLPEATVLEQGDVLVLEGGNEAKIVAAEEELLEVRPRDALHLAELCWHIGNRHLAAEILDERILILRDHVIKAMLEGLGAKVREVSEPFAPMRGAYSGHGHAHHDAHDHFGEGIHGHHG